MRTIYVPQHRAREYSPLALNIYKGCDHGCSYCYASSIARQTRRDYMKVEPREGLIKALKNYLEKNEVKEQVLLCFMGDPYCNANDKYKITRQVLELFLNHKVPTAILTKGGSRCMYDKDIFQQFKIQNVPLKIGATLTFYDNNKSLYYEPGAPPFINRIAVLHQLKNCGFKTWASIEPVLDPLESFNCIVESKDLIDEYKIGKLNHMKEWEDRINWLYYLQRVVDYLHEHNKPFYVKKDLRDACPDVKLTEEECDMDRFTLRSKQC